MSPEIRNGKMTGTGDVATEKFPASPHIHNLYLTQPVIELRWCHFRHFAEW